jgi:hypothetical protein
LEVGAQAMRRAELSLSFVAPSIPVKKKSDVNTEHTHALTGDVQVVF